MLLFQILQLKTNHTNKNFGTTYFDINFMMLSILFVFCHLTDVIWITMINWWRTQSANMNHSSLFMNESLLRMFQLTETGWWWIRFNSLLCFYTYYTHFTDLCAAAAQLSMHRLLKSNDWILSPHQLQPSSAINHWNNLIQLRLLKVPN